MSNKTTPPALAGLVEREVMPLATELRAQAHGWVEWRVQDPVSKSYCISFSRYGEDRVLDPEREAREWLRKHRAEFGAGGRFSGYEVARVEVATKSDRLMRDAADKLEQMATWTASVIDAAWSRDRSALLLALTSRPATRTEVEQEA